MKFPSNNSWRKMGENMKESNKKSINPFLWFVFAIVIPLLIVSSLTILILSIAGVNVTGWAKDTANKVPILSTFVKTEEEETVEEIKQLMNEKIHEKELEIARLQSLNEENEAIISRLNQDILKLKNEIKSNEQLSMEEQEKDEIKENEIKQIAASYENMKSKQAASVLEKVGDDIALEILKQLPDDTRGKILEAMDPEKAADLTKLFMN